MSRSGRKSRQQSNLAKRQQSKSYLKRIRYKKMAESGELGVKEKARKKREREKGLDTKYLADFETLQVIHSENFEIAEEEGYFIKSTNPKNIITSVRFFPDNPTPTFYVRYRTDFRGKYFYFLPPKYFALPQDLEQNREKITREMDEISSLIYKFKSERGE